MCEVGEQTAKVLREETLKRRAWHSRMTTWGLVTVFMVAFSLFAILYPMRALPDIKDMAPIVDHSGRRAYMVQACIFLSRELILDDGFSRMSKAHLAHELEEYLAELRRDHHAVRLGGDRGIAKGADFRFHSHNTVMYEPGCAWRDHDDSEFAHRRTQRAGAQAAGRASRLTRGARP
eukprot:1781487-Rhodomonas_salina.1